ncbi:Protein of unknown function [Pseudomonas cuatrocienegasensis]|uniref:UPF0311 protein SAMN05216600_102221 n=1 Tax=Pseudomonas cuatrocienegasensis TaxID=543360 RepID=A0ABY1B4L7_9PSED|nr:MULTISPECIES: DUF3237 domain-containing protein [Pseudomonas]OEC37253.1 hypothetical protein A7D25_00885 [Pseudomonas sp. 21C1]SEP90569.1 Protein of unknown function [Pseudomonas cuatrocienegasensis]
MRGMPNPFPHPVMTITAQIAEGEVVGKCADGYRVNYPIIGGHFSGPLLRGEVLPGGADWFLLRQDGVGDLDARYQLRTDDGVLINIHNIGLLTLTARGRELEALGVWPIPEAEYSCTCTPRFQVAEGPLGWLTQHAFFGQVHYPTTSEVLIHCYSLAALSTDENNVNP